MKRTRPRVRPLPGPRRAGRAFLAIAILIGIAGGGPCAVASEEPPPGFELGSPAQVERVREVLAEARAFRPERLVVLARALGRAGGWAAVEALAELAEHRDAGVRVAALEAAAQVGLRSRPLLRSARRAFDRSRDAERRAAIAALGRIGGGRDVPGLLDLATDEREPSALRRAAFRSLRDLSGLSVPYVPERWAYWWDNVLARDLTRLEEALASLQRAPRDEESARHLRTLDGLGWLDVEGVESLVQEWLVAPEPDLRARAHRLIARLGLADFAERVESAGRWASTDDLEAAVAEARGVLGIPEPETPLPPR